MNMLVATPEDTTASTRTAMTSLTRVGANASPAACSSDCFFLHQLAHLLMRSQSDVIDPLMSSRL